MMPRSGQLSDPLSSMQSGCCDALQTVRNSVATYPCCHDLHRGSTLSVFCASCHLTAAAKDNAPKAKTRNKRILMAHNIWSFQSTMPNNPNSKTSEVTWIPIRVYEVANMSMAIFGGVSNFPAKTKSNLARGGSRRKTPKRIGRMAKTTINDISVQ